MNETDVGGMVVERVVGLPAYLAEAGEMLTFVEGKIIEGLISMGLDATHFFFLSFVVLCVVLMVMRKAKMMWWVIGGLIVVIAIALIL